MTAIPSIWPIKDFNINISELSKNVGTVVEKGNNEYRVSFKKLKKKQKQKQEQELTYEGSWNADEKKPNGKGQFSIQTPLTILDVTFNEDGTLNSSVKGTLKTDLHIYKGFFSDVDTWDDDPTPTNIYIQSHGEQKSTLTFKYETHYAVYEGNFGNSIIQGQGTMTYVNGASNFGTWDSGRLHGQVIFNDPNMELSDMVGIWKNGTPITGFCFDKIEYGLIKESKKNKEAFYTGQWRNGQTLGKGQMTIKDTQENIIEKFIGLFSNYKLNSPIDLGTTGKHIKLYNNERKIEYYIGAWKNGKKTGVGMQFFEKKNISIYNGDWKDNKMEGNGLCLYHLSKSATGLYDINSIYPMYIGKWEENLANGFGIWLHNEPTQPVIQKYEIVNIDELRVKIGRYTNHKFIEGFELNPSPSEGDTKPGVSFPIADGDIQYIHEGIQDIIRNDNNNNKETFINQHIQLAEFNINNILESGLQGVTFAEGEKMSIKDILTADEIREYQQKFQGGKKKTQRSGISGRKTRKKRKKKKNRTRICKKKIK